MTVVMCDGTWSKPGSRSAVAMALKRELADRVAFEFVEYPGAFGPATGQRDISYAESVSVGAKAIAAAVRATPNPAVVVAYSQGAAAMHKFAREILPSDGALDVRAFAALGNPHQPVHSGRSGIVGPAPISPRWPLFSLYAPGDPIADLPLGSPLRSVADVSEWMSVRSPEAGKRWAFEVLNRMGSQRVQAWWQPWRWPEIASAARYAENYLGTCHTTDYIRGGYVARLARLIEGVAA